MRKLLVFLSVVLSGCASITGRGHNPEELIGIWFINHTPSEVDYSVIEYLPSGDKCEVLYSMSLESGVEITLFWNKWNFDGNIINTTMHATNGSIPIGYEINDRVLKLTKAKLEVVIDDPGEWDVEYHQKVNRAKAGQVCSLVMTALSNSGPPT